MFGDTGAPRRLIVADAEGHRLKTFSVASPQTPHAWTGNSTLLTLATGQSRRLRAVTLPDGAPRMLFETNDFTLEPSWSPDGRSVAITRFGSTGCEVKVMNPDGSPLRSVSLAKAGACVNASWTNDQRWVVFSHYQPNAKPAIVAMEAATGQSKELRTFADEDVPQWVLDHDVVVVSDNVGGAGGSRHAVWQIDLTGNAKSLREVTVEDGASITVLDRNQAIVTRKGSRDARLIALATGDERTIAIATSGFVSPRASLSVDRQWLAFLVAPTGTDNTQLTRLELVKLDQTARRTIDLPFPADAGINPLVLPGATGAVVAERRRPDQPANVHFVDASTHSATKLFTYVIMGRPAEIALSPDGRTVLYLLTEQLPPSIAAIDVTTIR